MTLKDLLSAMIQKINSSIKTINGIAPDNKGNIDIEIIQGSGNVWEEMPEEE